MSEQPNGVAGGSRKKAKLSSKEQSTGASLGAATQTQNCKRTSSQGSDASKPFKQSTYDIECNTAIQALELILGTTEGAAGVLAKENGKTKPEDENLREVQEETTDVGNSIQRLHEVAHLPHKFSDLYLFLYKWRLDHTKTIGGSQVKAYRSDVMLEANASVLEGQNGKSHIAEKPGNTKSTKFHLSKHGNMILSLRGLDKSRNQRQIWCDWLYVARTDRNSKQPISYGLFSCRRFQKGECIGPYVGNIVWEKACNKEDKEAKQPLKETSRPLLPAMDENIVHLASKMKGFVQTTEDSIRIVTPLVSAERKVEDRLFLGFEFMAQDNKQCNVAITDNGLVKATKVLKKGDQLFAPLLMKGVSDVPEGGK